MNWFLWSTKTALRCAGEIFTSHLFLPLWKILLMAARSDFPDPQEYIITKRIIINMVYINNATISFHLTEMELQTLLGAFVYHKMFGKNCMESDGRPMVKIPNKIVTIIFSCVPACRNPRQTRTEPPLAMHAWIGGSISGWHLPYIQGNRKGKVWKGALPSLFFLFFMPVSSVQNGRKTTSLLRLLTRRRSLRHFFVDFFVNFFLLRHLLRHPLCQKFALPQKCRKISRSGGVYKSKKLRKHQKSCFWRLPLAGLFIASGLAKWSSTKRVSHKRDVLNKSSGGAHPKKVCQLFFLLWGEGKYCTVCCCSCSFR